MTTTPKDIESRLSRRQFLTAAGLAGAGLGLAACSNPNNLEGEYLSPEIDRMPWETDDVLAMAAVLSGASTEATTLRIAQGFRVKRQVEVTIDGTTSVWWYVKPPAGYMSARVYYNPEQHTWLKMIEQTNPDHMAAFRESIEAYRASVAASNETLQALGHAPVFLPDDIVSTAAAIDGRTFLAMKTPHYGYTLELLLKSGSIDRATAQEILEISYQNALRMGLRGWRFVDTNYRNILVGVDETGRIMPTSVVNIDMTNRGIRIPPGQMESTRSVTIESYVSRARGYGIPFNRRAAELAVGEEVMSVYRSQGLPLGTKITTEIPVAGGGTALVEEISVVGPQPNVIGLADDTVSAQAKALSAGELVQEQSWLMRVLRHPLVKRAGPYIKFLGDIGILMWVKDMVIPDKTTWGEARVFLNSEINDYYFDPEVLFKETMEYKKAFRIVDHPEFADFAEMERQRFETLVEEISGWYDETERAARRPEIEQYAFSLMIEDPYRLKEESMMPRKWTFAGPKILDQPRRSDVNLSAVESEDGTRTLMIWRDIPLELKDTYQFNDYIILALQCEPDEEVWEVVSENPDPTVRIPRTNMTVGEISGAFVWDSGRSLIKLSFPEDMVRRFSDYAQSYAPFKAAPVPPGVAKSDFERVYGSEHWISYLVRYFERVGKSDRLKHDQARYGTRALVL